jgi:hypothetical protein
VGSLHRENIIYSLHRKNFIVHDQSSSILSATSIPSLPSASPKTFPPVVITSFCRRCISPPSFASAIVLSNESFLQGHGKLKETKKKLKTRKKKQN